MRWIRYSHAGKTAYGMLEGDRIAPVAGDPFSGYTRTAERLALEAVKIEVPVVPPTFYCVGLNYAEHVRSTAALRHTTPQLPQRPDVDLDALETRVRVNGAQTTRFATNAMLFGVATYISTMTRYLTLYPGDMIWMGTDGTSPNLKPSDVVEIEITGIGTLRNPFVAEPR